MDEAVNDLVTSPFKEIVEKGTVAIENAQNAKRDDMLKAARDLVREGERALKKIEPQCKKHLDEYGVNFVNALKENDEIAGFRSCLNDVLWEFDDFVEAHDFEAEKFTEVRALSRKAAPRIYDILITMQLEVPQDHRPISPGTTLADLAAPLSEIQKTAQLQLAAQQLLGRTDHFSRGSSVRQLVDMMKNHSDPGNGSEFHFVHTPDPNLERQDSERSEKTMDTMDGPRPPSTNPWQVGSHASSTTAADVQDATSETEPTAPTNDSASYLISPMTDPSPFAPASMSPRLFDVGMDHMDHMDHIVYESQETHQDQGRRNRSQTLEEGQISPRMTSVDFGYSETRPPVATSSHVKSHNPLLQEKPAANTTSRRSHSSSIHSYLSANDSLPNPSFEARGRDSGYETATREAGHSPAMDNSTLIRSIPENAESEYPDQSRSTPLGLLQQPQQQHPEAASVDQDDQPGLELAEPFDPSGENGLIPVDTAGSKSKGPRPPREPNLTITESSSINQMKGFCEGAKDVIRGGIGIRRAKKPGMFVAADVGRCTKCFFELAWDKVEADIHKSPSACYTSNGVGFRLKFLLKSHVTVKNMDEELYACPFCFQAGRTIEESDATIFFHRDKLFQHLARHPRPLPDVPGIVVVDGPEVPEDLRTSYDLHFNTAPKDSIMTGISREVSRLPTVTAIETFRKSPHYTRLPPDSSEPLQFAVGAKIVGVEFPVRFKGEWAIGWHDNVRAPFPVTAVRLDLPARIGLPGKSNRTAVVRWKFDPKEKGDWLKLNKGDVITNITWTYSENWCWSGISPKGKWGVFPQSHLDPTSVRDIRGSPSDSSSVASDEKRRVGIFSRIRNPVRQTSINTYDLSSPKFIY